MTLSTPSASVLVCKLYVISVSRQKLLSNIAHILLFYIPNQVLAQWLSDSLGILNTGRDSLSFDSGYTIGPVLCTE